MTDNSSFLTLSDSEFLDALKSYAKFKQRSFDTHNNIHVPELNHRIHLSLDLPSTQPLAPLAETAVTLFQPDPHAQYPDLQNENEIEIVLLGNSMLERFKTTGKTTHIGDLCLRNGIGWNCGVGGDTSQNVDYRLTQGIYAYLKNYHESQRLAGKPGIKVWVLASGTNDLHPKQGLREKDVAAWKMAVLACLRIAPTSSVLACSIMYRRDIADMVVDRANGLLAEVVREVNEEIGRGSREGEKHGHVVWVETRHCISKDMLEDHVHLKEEGYHVWDGVLWRYVEEAIGGGIGV